jgi:drug/metabolite transporter (DMT)-like permease
LIPFFAAFAAAVGLVLEKTVLTYQKMDSRLFNSVVFLFLFLGTLLLFPFLGKIDPRFIELKYILLLAGVVILASIWNTILAHGIKYEKVNEIELIMMLQPISIILISSIFLTNERHWSVFLAAIIGALALIVSHINKKHLDFNRNNQWMLVYLLLVGLETVMVKELLAVYSPVALYMLRTAFIFLIVSLWFRPDWTNLKAKQAQFLSITTVVAITQMVLTYYGYLKYGVIFTTLILVITPLLVYFFSILVLKEKIKPRTIIAAVIILFCIAYAQWMRMR